MEDFSRQFALEAVAKLKQIAADLPNTAVSEFSTREIFRTLHTIKGTAQTFGFSAASFLAHHIENLLARREASDALFRDALQMLIESLDSKDFEISESFLTAIGADRSSKSPTSQLVESYAVEIPDEFTAQLSTQEKAALQTAAETGKNLFCLEVGFALADFAAGLIGFREILDASGEIIATLPGAQFTDGEKIGFRILYASSAASSEIESLAERNDATVIFGGFQNAAANDFRRAAQHAVRHGREISARCGKQIRFEVTADETTLSGIELKIVFDALLHLVRNAVDHGVKSAGTIEIHLKTAGENLCLTVSDDGGGIDLQMIKARAAAQNLLAADAVLNDREMIDLIFLPEFSTKSEVTEISGRGVGLDAVKTAVTTFGGSIRAVCENGKGTTFEILLPRGQTQRTGI